MLRWLLLSALLLGACLPFSSDPSLSSESPPEAQRGDEWQELLPGLDYRRYRDARHALLLALRVDPGRFHFRAHYRPGQPLRVEEWRETLGEPLVIINSNFFTPEHTVLGLLVSDGVAHGTTYRNRGGTFVVQDGVPRVRATTLEPYRGEMLEQAVQAFPLLVLNGQAAYTNQRDSRPARRTLIGQDTQGRIYLLVAPGLQFSLYELSAYLPRLDIAWTNAFNLDGGGSTMLHIEPLGYSLPSFDPVPAVLAVYPTLP